MEVGLNIASVMRRSSGRYYTVMSACEGATPVTPTTSGSASKRGVEAGGGSAIDWFYHELNVRYAFQIKLRDTGSYGFLLPSEHIIPTGEEVFSALKLMADFIGGNNGRE
jgi:extracellular matrix protein 14